MQDIIIKVEANTLGPLSPKKVRNLIKQGVFSSAHLVWSNSEGEWVPAWSVPELKEMFNLTHAKAAGLSKVLAVASGKGGVGKTVLASSLGVGLASAGRTTTVVDADFGGANLHTAMGVLQPEYNFDDFFSNSGKPLSDFLIETPVANLTMIGGTCGSILTTPKYHQKQRFIRTLRKLTAEYVVLDLGGGSQFNVIDFFLLADEPIVVVTPELPSVQEAFSFIKMALLRRLVRVFRHEPAVLALVKEGEVNRPGHIIKTMEDIYHCLTEIDIGLALRFRSTLNSFAPKLVLNKRSKRSDDEEAAAIQTAAFELLSIEVDYLGHISFDENVEKAIQQFRPFLLHSPASQAARDIEKLIDGHLLGLGSLRRTLRKRKWQQELNSITEYYPEVKLVDEVPIMDIVKSK